ncbi:hypothetical protein HanIR_Chr09g0440701 [Helianthus annuus]|nr:hypothetical protein HanIR_Chr09g0440701 [Helianthus annuus]
MEYEMKYRTSKEKLLFLSRIWNDTLHRNSFSDSHSLCGGGGAGWFWWWGWGFGGGGGGFGGGGCGGGFDGGGGGFLEKDNWYLRQGDRDIYLFKYIIKHIGKITKTPLCVLHKS